MLGAFNNAFQADGDVSRFEKCATQEVLQNYATMAAAYSQNASFLRDRVRGTAQLLSDTLNLKYQKIGQSVSENTLAFTNAASQDSATVRVITVVTLLYLPATFVAVCLYLRKGHKQTDACRRCSECNFLERTRREDSRLPRLSCGSSLH